MATSQPRRKKKCYQNSVSRIFGICDERDLEDKTENIGPKSFIKKKNIEKIFTAILLPFFELSPKKQVQLVLEVLNKRTNSKYTCVSIVSLSAVMVTNHRYQYHRNCMPCGYAHLCISS